MSECIITDAGLAALAYASAHGTTIRPAYFKFSSEKDHYVDGSDHLLSTLTEMAYDVWYTHNINYYKIIDPTANLVEFVCEALPDAVAPSPNSQTWACGLFLEDDTLFMIAKPDAAFPATVHQIFRLELAYNAAGSLVEFVYPAINTFLLLGDTPDSYAGQAGKVVKVASSELGLEFDTVISSILDINDVTDTNYTGKKGYTFEVNQGETAVGLVPVNRAFVERAYEDLCFIPGFLASEPRSISLYYFDTGYAGSYSANGIGALARVSLALASGAKTIDLLYNETTGQMTKATCTFGAEVVEYSMTYHGTTGSITGVTVNVV